MSATRSQTRNASQASQSRTGGRTRTPSEPNKYVAVTVAVSAPYPYEDLSEEEEEEEQGFQSWNTERYAAMEQPVKSYCLDMIAHCQATGEDMHYGGLRKLLDKTRMFAKYRNWEACYDDTFFKIPLNEWIEKTGLTREQTEAVNNCFGSYMGSLRVGYYDERYENVQLWGSA